MRSSSCGAQLHLLVVQKSSCLKAAGDSWAVSVGILVLSCMSLSDKGSPENSTFTTEKDSVKHSTSHIEIHQPTTAGVYFKSSVGSIDASGCWTTSWDSFALLV